MHRHSSVIRFISCEIHSCKLSVRLFVVFLQKEGVPLLTAGSTMDDIWAVMMMSFIYDARATLKFAKKIPG